MHRIKFGLAIGLTAVLLAGSMADAGILRKLDFINDPTGGEGWSLQQGSPVPWETPNSAEGIGAYNNLANIDAPDNRSYSSCRYDWGTCGDNSPTAAMRSLEMRARVIETAGQFSGGVTLNAIYKVESTSDKSAWIALNLINNDSQAGVQVMQPTGASKVVAQSAINGGIDVTEFHTYGLDLLDLDAGAVNVYIDGIVQPDLAFTDAKGGVPGFDGRVEIGNNTGGAVASAEFDWVRIYDTTGFPEPATLGMMIAGGLLALRRRR